MKEINQISLLLPIQEVESCLGCLGDQKYFSSVDLNSAYHQIKLEKIDKQSKPKVRPYIRKVVNCEKDNTK